MSVHRLHHQRGIALGPILFIIAVLAILAAAIAAGSGGFSANTNTESAKTMAEVAINSCGAFQDAMNLMLHNGCDPTQIDWTPNGSGYPSGTTWTGGDFSAGGTGHAGSGQCAMFDPRGGGMLFKQLPLAAMIANPTGAYISVFGSARATQIDAFAGYPVFKGDTCFKNVGTCADATNTTNLGTVVLFYYYLDTNVCSSINGILRNNLNLPQTYINISYAEYQTVYSGTNVANSGTQLGLYAGSTPTGINATIEGCGRSSVDNSNGAGVTTSYEFVCPLMIR